MDPHFAGWDLPVPCPSTATTAEIAGNLPLPSTNPPDTFSSLSRLDASIPSAADLQSAAEWLAATDIRYLEHAAEAAPAPQIANPPSHLAALLQVSPHALDIRHRTRPAAAAPPPPEPVLAAQSRLAPAVHVVPSTHQQQQQMPQAVPRGDAQKPRATSKKRKAHAENSEAFVPKVADKQHVAESAGRAVAAFLARLRAVQPGASGPADSGATTGSAAADAGLANLASSALPALAQELSAARSQGVLHLLDITQLQQLLLGLLPLMKQGLQLQLPADDVGIGAVGRVVTLALDTAAACLQVLAAPDMPVQLYTEELLTSTVDLTKTQLQYNVLAYCDVKYQRLYRPSLTIDGGQPSKKAKTMAQAGVPKVVTEIAEKARGVLHLLSLVVSRTRIQPELLLPLTRLALATLVTDSLHLLQMNSIDLAVAVFKAYPEHREAVLGDMMAGVFNQMGSKAPARRFVVSTGQGGGKLLQVQMSTGLIMQLVQGAVDLPALDAGTDMVFRTFTGAVACADAFWHAIFKLLPAAKAVKSDTAQDLKVLLEDLFADLLTAQCLPEWPSADTLLRRGVKALLCEQGLQHPDSHVKQMAVECTGLVAARLFQSALQAEQEADWVEQLLGLAGTTADDDLPERACSSILQHVLLDALQRGVAPGPQQAAACSYLCCSMLQEALNQLRQRDEELSAEQVQDLVLHYRQLLSMQVPALSAAAGLTDSQQAALASLHEDPFPLDWPQACCVTRRLVMDGPMGRGRLTLLRRLADASNRGRQDANAAQVRAKAVKALAGVVEVDTRVLQLPEVRNGLQTALADESISVREAAIELLGRYLTTNPLLAEDFFDIIAAASNDNGVSVRKRAVKTLWDCCVHCPGFTRRADAVIAILQRAGDNDKSMQTLVTRICCAMWFDPKAVVDADFGSSEGRSGTQRAQDLADVALRVYDAGPKAIRLPLGSTHPLVVVVRESLAAGSGTSKQHQQVLAGAQEVASALLQLIVQSDDVDGGMFGPLLALHTLCCAQPSLLVPDKDPASFLRALAPYAIPSQPPEVPSAASRGDPTAQDAVRRAAEVCVALLSTLTVVLHQLQAADKDTLAELMIDLERVIVKEAHHQVVATACQCLASLCVLLPEAAHRVTAIAQRCYSLAAPLVQGHSRQPGSSNLAAQVKLLPRFLFVIGQLCRHASHILDAAAADAAEADGASPFAASCRQCLRLFIDAWCMHLPAAVSPVVVRAIKEQALQAMGLVFLAQPAAMLEQEPSQVYTAVLSQGAHPVGIKARVLANLVELLQVEEDTLVALQKVTEAEAAAANLPSTLPANDVRPLAKVNGEGDTFGVCSGILQRHWDAVLQLATTAGESMGGGGAAAAVAGVPSTPGTPGSVADAAAAAGLRRKAIELIEVVLRGGLVAPWTAVSPLVALLTDTQQETRALALQVLKAAAEKHTEFVAGQLPAGVTEAYLFHKRMWQAKHPGQLQPQDPDPHLVQGLCSMYSEIVQQDAKMRHKLLSCLLKVFEDALNCASRAAAEADLYQLSSVAHLVGALPFKRGDEPLMLLHTINSLISRSGPVLLDKLKTCLVHSGLHSKLQLDMGDVEDAAAEAAAAAENGAAEPHSSTAHAAATAANSSHLLHQRTPEQQQAGRATPSTQAAAAAATGGGPGPLVQGDSVAVLKASMALAMLLVVKQYLMAAYHLTPERVAGFELRGEKKRAEEKVLISKAPVPFTLQAIKIRCVEDRVGGLLVDHYRTLQQLLEADACSYSKPPVHQMELDSEDGQEDGLQQPCNHHNQRQQQHPSTGKPPLGGKKLLLFQDALSKLPRTGSTRGKGGRGGGSRRASAADSSAQRRASVSSTGRGAKKRRRAKFSDLDAEDAAADSDDDATFAPAQRLTYR